MAVFWNNLSFTSGVSNFEKLLSTASCGVCFMKRFDQDILKNTFGTIKQGELVALMGPSGAGKSTLLNCLTLGSMCNGCRGAIYVIGLNEPVRASLINQNESEHLLQTLTVRQSLRYASQLKNSAKTPPADHEDIVRNLVKDLDMKSCENTPVDRCSGGQKKRLAIGLELTSIQKPHFLFLDEPTSGLDSYVGFKVVKLLSNLAQMHNMGIVTTIHQPSFKIFAQFSKALILSGTGEFIFSGAPSGLRHFLEQSGYIFEQGFNENPADVAIELASAMKRKPTSLKVAKDKYTKVYYINLPDVFGESSSDSDSSLVSLIDDSFDAPASPDSEHGRICRKMVDMIQFSYEGFLHQHLMMESEAERQEVGLCSNGSKFTLHNLRTLFLRSAHTSIVKQKKFILIRLALHLIVGIVLAVLYNRNVGKSDSCVKLIYPINDPHNCSCMLTPAILRGESQDLANSNVKFQFFSLLFLMFASLMPTVLTFPSEIKLFLNEYRNGWYTTSTYYIAKTITEIPFQLLFPMMYVYFLYLYSHQIGMDDWYGGIIGFMSARYRAFLWVTILCCLIAQGLGFLIGVLCVRSFNISIIVSSTVLLFIFLFSGFFVKTVQMSESVSWITYFSFIRFGFESLLLAIYGNARCDEQNDSSVLVSFGIEDKDFAFNIFMLIVHLVVIRLLAFLVLKYKAEPNFVKLDYKWISIAYNFVQSKTSKLSFVKNLMENSTLKTMWLCLIFLGVQIILGISIGLYFIFKNLS